MGYRSDVTYIVTFNCVDQPEKAYAQFIHFYEWVTKHHKIEEKGGQMTERHIVKGVYDYNNHRTLGYGKFYWNVDEMTLVFEAEDIKYYDSYIDTQWDEQLLKQVEKYSCGVYKFVRLGEDPADVEYKDYAGKDVDERFSIDLYTETRIVCDLPDEKDFTEKTS
jgi:hypothetical protein